MGGIIKRGGSRDSSPKPGELGYGAVMAKPVIDSALGSRFESEGGKSSPTSASASKEEDKAARRRARRGGRAMLSESRLNPEQGVSTLGTTGL